MGNFSIPQTILTLGPAGLISHFFAAASKNQLGPIGECPPPGRDGYEGVNKLNLPKVPGAVDAGEDSTHLSQLILQFSSSPNGF